MDREIHGRRRRKVDKELPEVASGRDLDGIWQKEGMILASTGLKPDNKRGVDSSPFLPDLAPIISG
jgi:hypothetical protein